MCFLSCGLNKCSVESSSVLEICIDPSNSYSLVGLILYKGLPSSSGEGLTTMGCMVYGNDLVVSLDMNVLLDEFEKVIVKA